MKRYDGYLNMMNWFFALCAFTLVFGFAFFFPLVLIYGPLKMIMGLVQLGEGVSLWLKSDDKPAWFGKWLGLYWFASIFYFIVLWLIIEFRGTYNNYYMVWLFIVPWFIAIYQYLMVRRLKKDLINRPQVTTATWEVEGGELA